jgi:hypothetical protein
MAQTDDVTETLLGLLETGHLFFDAVGRRTRKNVTANQKMEALLSLL